MDPIAEARETMRQAHVRGAWHVLGTMLLGGAAFGVFVLSGGAAYSWVVLAAMVGWALWGVARGVARGPEVERARAILVAAEKAEVARAVGALDTPRETDALGQLVARLRDAGDPRLATLAAEAERRARALKLDVGTLDAAIGAERAQPDPSPERVARLDAALARKRDEIARIEGALRELNVQVALREADSRAGVDGLQALLDEVAAEVEVDQAGRVRASGRERA